MTVQIPSSTSSITNPNNFVVTRPWFTFFENLASTLNTIVTTGDVISVFGRAGMVVAETGDYTASQITNVPSGSITATNVQSAINQLGSDIGLLDVTSLSGDNLTYYPVFVNGAGTLVTPYINSNFNIINASFGSNATELNVGSLNIAGGPGEASITSSYNTFSLAANSAIDNLFNLTNSSFQFQGSPLQLYPISGGSNYTGIQASASITSSYTLTLPTTAGSSGNVLSTDGTGILSWAAALSTSLTSANIFVGNASNVATEVMISGDATLDNTGMLELITTGVIPSTYGDATNVGQFTVDSKGRITSAANVSIMLPVANGGTGQTSFTQYGILIGQGTSPIVALTPGTGNGQLLSNFVSANPQWTNTLYPFTSNQGDIIYATAINNFTTLAKSTASTRYLSNQGTSNNPSWSQVNLSNGVTGSLSRNLIATSTAHSFVYNDNTTGALTTYSTSTVGNFLGLAASNFIGEISLAGTSGQIAISSSFTLPILTLTLGIDPSYIGQTSITTLGTITAGTWNSTQISEIYGGTNQTSYTLGDTLYSSAANTLSKLAGNTTTTKQYLSQTGTGTVSAAPVWATISGSDITGAALTRTNDTNVTLTLGGSPTTALLNATSLTLGWTGQLGLSRGGTNADLSATGGTSQVLKQTTSGGAITVAQLAASDLSNGTSGSGAVALVNSPTFITPTLGVATATTINKVTITTPATGSTLTIQDGFTLTISGNSTINQSLTTTSTPAFTAAILGATSSSLSKTLQLLGTGTGTSSPGLLIGSTGQTTDNKYWGFDVNGTTLYGYALNDAQSSTENWLQVSRSGTAISSIYFASQGDPQVLAIVGTASGSNYNNIQITNGVGGTSGPTISTFGTDTNINLNITCKGTGNVAINNSLLLGSLTSGSVLYAGTSGLISQNNSQLFWDATNNLFGIGINSSLQDKLHVKTASGGGRIRMENGDTNFAVFYSKNTTNAWSAGTSSTGIYQIYNESSSIGVFTIDRTTSDVTALAGNLIVNTVGKTLKIKQGSNACAGTGAVLSGGTVTVNTTAVATGDIILLNCTAAGGTQGIVRTSISNGTSFTITSSSGSDTSTYSWVIIKAA